MAPRLDFGRLDPDAFRVRLRFDAAPTFTVIEYAFAAPASTISASDDLVVISARGSGFDLRLGRDDVDTSMPYLMPQEGFAAKWETVAARAVMLDRDAITSVARGLTGDDDFTLASNGVAPRSRALGLHWEQAAHRVRSAMLETPEAFDEPVVAQAAFNRLAVSYLHAFQPVLVRADGQRLSVVAQSAIVRRAIEYMHAHAAQPITIQEIASAAQISTRGLHAAFIAQVGRSPSEHLRAIRLDGVRDELRFAPPGQSIAAVARRWGFVHLSRFAESYAREFGELPSETDGARRRMPPAGPRT
jgi:AraC-like DNA-binding protein